MIEKKRFILIILIILILTSYTTTSFEASEGAEKKYTDGPLSPSDYSNPSAYPTIFQNPNFDQSNVPSEYISLIPADKVDPNKVKDKSKLTKEQLEYDDNINKVSNWGELNQDVVSDILSDKTNKEVKVNGVSDGQVGDNTFSFPSVAYLELEDTQILNGNNIVYKDNKLTAEYAEMVKNKDTTISKTSNFAEDDISISLDKAQKIMSGCVDTDGVANAEIVANNEKITFVTQQLDFIDCDGNKVTFAGDVVKISKKEPHKIEIAKGTLVIEHQDYNETISTETSATATVNEFGYECINYGYNSKYFSEYTDLIKDFMLYMQDNYHLCLRKVLQQNFEVVDGNSGVVDFVEDRYKLNGIIDYSKPVFYYDSSGLHILDTNMEYVYRSYDYGNKAVFNLDDTGGFVDELTVDNKNPQNEVLANIYNGDYLIYESFENNEIVGRVKGNDKTYPFVIKTYNPMFNELHRLIVFEDGALIFDPESEHSTIIRTESFGKANEFINKEVSEYDKHFPECINALTYYFNNYLNKNPLDILGWVNE